MAKVITVSFPGGKKVDAQFGGHTVHTDQGPAAGGEGSAPTPFELFLASLATCAGYYALEFCLARKIDTQGLKVELKTERDPETKMFRKVGIEVTLPAGFPAQYKEPILRAVNLCAVKKHVQNAPEFEVTAK